MEFPRCASGSGAADNSVHQLSLVIRNIFNVFETLISEVHQHDTASESSGCEKKNFFDRCGSQLPALAHLHRLVAFATN
jgi:hypothetical protein